MVLNQGQTMAVDGLARIIDGEDFAVAAGEYRERWAVDLLLCRPDGWVVAGSAANDPEACAARALAVHEALRWGEPTFHLAPGEQVIWAVAATCNAALVGGLVAVSGEHRAFGQDPPAVDLRRAATDLRRLAEDHNWTNAALLEAHRQDLGRERARAEAIHQLKAAPPYSLRRMYLIEEPDLLAAIRQGDRGRARDVLNRLLVGIHSCAGERMTVVKSFYLELVVTVCRTAVEAGGAPEALLQSNLVAAAKLAAIDTEFELVGWLRASLESALDAVAHGQRHDPEAQLGAALRYMQEHWAEDLSRDEVAAQAHLSPAHFSRQFRRQFGRTYTEALTRLRLDHACEIVAWSDKPLALVAMDCGFADQSYFTKVFRRQMGVTPAQYRRTARPAGRA